ncbi:hypothetical protein HanRHA438_Chr11g0531541 [Helianthus annuus]|nr:hypothetical protein HanRHA438_Chr11g0531541 [Helianthus annuus]
MGFYHSQIFLIFYFKFHLSGCCTCPELRCHTCMILSQTKMQSCHGYVQLSRVKFSTRYFFNE